MKKYNFPSLITDLLDKHHIEYQLINNGGAVSVNDFAKKMSVPPITIAKVLVVKTPFGYVSVALSGTKRLSMKKLAQTLGISNNSVNLLSKDGFESIVGVPVGATPPLGIDIPLIMDKGLEGQGMIYSSCGTLVDIIGIRPLDLVKISGGTIADVAD
ncbi:MAG: YbaK/EbsC family protein [Candidatus Taylorbacteria bacterium]